MIDMRELSADVRKSVPGGRQDMDWMMEYTVQDTAHTEEQICNSLLQTEPVLEYREGWTWIESQDKEKRKSGSEIQEEAVKWNKPVSNDKKSRQSRWRLHCIKKAL